MYNNKIKLMIILSISIYVLAGCGKKSEEVVNIDYEHIVTDRMPSPAATPVMPDDNTSDDNTASDNEDKEGNNNQADASGVFEVDGMVFTPVNDTVKVIANSANLRKGPSTNYDKVILSKAGDTFTRTAEGGSGWDQLQYQGETVYIWNEYIKKVENVNKADADDIITTAGLTG